MWGGVAGSSRSTTLETGNLYEKVQSLQTKLSAKKGNCEVMLVQVAAHNQYHPILDRQAGLRRNCIHAQNSVV